MADAASQPRRRRRHTWRFDRFWPLQGDWTVDEFLALDEGEPVEFTRGCLELLPSVTGTHQEAATLFYDAVHAALEGRGRVYRLPWTLRLGRRRFRKPDVSALFEAHDARRFDRYWTGADLVCEVVSPQLPERDYLQKRREYARAGIPEYWLIDHRRRRVRVMRLDGKSYNAADYHAGDVALSPSLPNLRLDVAGLFAKLDADRAPRWPRTFPKELRT